MHNRKFSFVNLLANAKLNFIKLKYVHIYFLPVHNCRERSTSENLVILLCINKAHILNHIFNS